MSLIVLFFFFFSDGETALSLLMGFLSFIGMVIMITYTVHYRTLKLKLLTIELSLSYSVFSRCILLINTVSISFILGLWDDCSSFFYAERVQEH